jgi:hypothetical protein
LEAKKAAEAKKSAAGKKVNDTSSTPKKRQRQG